MPSKKSAHGPSPSRRCTASYYPLNFPHSQGLYRHDQAAHEDRIFGWSNPPPNIQRTGRERQILMALQPETTPSGRPRGWAGEPRTSSGYAELDAHGTSSTYGELEGRHLARPDIRQYTTVESYDWTQEMFLKYHRGCTCPTCRCDDRNGCNCLWEGGCMYEYGQFAQR
ncbi:hypothetical protein DL95DRAFT_4832 [Leptodontidium sp. 2 PMI_412]|nr:hypothetical protein DL95DRAFT_4832 [Leptodontidium sp. 2 PMI_412]